MDESSSRYKGYALAALLGAIGGGLFVAIVTRAIPRMMSQVISAGMQKMMAQMKAGGLEPGEM